MKRLLLSSAALVALVSCGDDSNTAIKDGGHSDAPAFDAAPDAFCGADILYTGEYVDWDSTDAAFLGIFNATIAVDNGSGSRLTTKTPPNGRFILCIGRDTDPVTTTTPDPTDTGSNGSDTYLPGVMVGKHLQIAEGVLSSARSMRQSRVASMFEQIGSAYDPTKGQLFVHASGGAEVVPLSVDHTAATTQSFDSTEVWGPGNAGTYVFFPNITLTGSTVALSAGSATLQGTGNIPVSAGQLTYVEVDVPPN